MDPDFRGFEMEEADNASLTEVQTLTIDCEREKTDRRILSDYGKGRLPQHTGLSGDLRPDSGWAGLWQADEGQICPTADRRRREQSPTADLLPLHLHGSRGGEHSEQCCHPAW